jgi:Toastrack DUF4097
MTATRNPHEVQPPTSQPQPRKRRVWPWILTGLVLVVGALAGLAWLKPLNTTSQTETLDDIAQISIDVTGSVSLTGGDHTELTITKEWSLGGEPGLEVDSADGVAKITGDCGWLFIRCTTSVTGTVTAGAVVEVRTVAGSIEVSGISNDVDLTTSAGNVTAQSITGNATLRTSAGSIDGSITDGDVDAETSAGRIELTVLGEFTSLSAVTSAGDIDLTVADEVYRVDTDTAAGSVDTEVRTDPESTLEIVARSSAGSITIRPEG